MTKWYEITAKKDKARVLIYDQIGENWFGEGVSAKKFVKELDALDVSEIALHINSPGGSVFDGTSIYNALKAHKADIEVKIDGIAASIASVIAMAGDTVEMPENALLMIHDPSALVQGTAKDMEKMIEALDRIKSGMVAAYKSKVNISESEISEMMSAETWFTAAEAAELGFADQQTEPVKMAAQFQALADFKNVPESIYLGTFTANSTDTQEVKTMDINFDLIKNEHPEIFAEIQKTVDLEEITAGAKKDGAAAELKRIQAVREQSISGHEALVERLMFDGETTAEQAAIKILAAERNIRSKMVADLKDDAPEPLKVVATTEDAEPEGYDHLPTKEKCKAKWEKSKDLQSEFLGDFDAYLAYEKAMEKGRAKVLG